MEDQQWKGPFPPQQGPHQPQCAAYLQQGPLVAVSPAGVTKDDLNEIKLELKEIGVTLRQLAVQDERIQANRRDLDQAKVDIHELFVKYNALRSDHDKCGIGSVQNNMAWIQWLVVLIIASLLGITFALVKDHMVPERMGNGGSAKQSFDSSIDQDIVCDGPVSHGGIVRLSHQIDDTAGRDDLQDSGRGSTVLPDHSRAVDSFGVRRGMRGTQRLGADASIVLCRVPDNIRHGLRHPGSRKVRPAKLPGSQERGERAGNGSGVQRPVPDSAAPVSDLPGPRPGDDDGR